MTAVGDDVVPREPKAMGIGHIVPCLITGLFALLFVSSAGAQSRLEGSGRVDDARREEGESDLSLVRGADELQWSVTLFAGQVSKDYLPQIVGNFSAHLEDSYIGGVALDRQLATLGEHVRLEVEGQVAKHFGRQDHWELNALGILRWVTFPWNAYLVTTIAVGDGPSYATKVPKLEAELDSRAGQWLNYLLLELTVALPEHPEWALVGRIHHRSGFFDSLAPGGSNALAVGIRYRF